MLRALEQIRRMRGGAQSHLMRCDDGHYYVVKFQNNPQHRRILVNELLGTKLAARLGLPTTPVEIVYVSEDLIRLTPDLCVEMQGTRVVWTVAGANRKAHDRTRTRRADPRDSAGVVRRRLGCSAAAGRTTPSTPHQGARAAAGGQKHDTATISKLDLRHG